VAVRIKIAVELGARQRAGDVDSALGFAGYCGKALVERCLGDGSGGDKEKGCERAHDPTIAARALH
jgi:hypothetical protein